VTGRSLPTNATLASKLFRKHAQSQCQAVVAYSLWALVISVRTSADLFGKEIFKQKTVSTKQIKFSDRPENRFAANEDERNVS